MAALSCGQELGKWPSGLGVVLDTDSAEMPCSLHHAGSLQERVALFLLPRASVGCVPSHSGGTGAGRTHRCGQRRSQFCFLRTGGCSKQGHIT